MHTRLIFLLVPVVFSGLFQPPGIASRQRGAAATPALMSPADLQSLPARPADHRVPYGDDATQFAELRLPSGGGPHPVVVLVHGGCWKAQYASLRDLAPMGDALKAEGIASWNVEYRRLGQTGGGWPGTYADVGRAIDHLRQVAPVYRLHLGRVAVVGHSAGGHLAMWAAMRQRLPPKSPAYAADPVPLRGVINLAGTIDMRENIAHMEAECRDTVVTAMLGGTPESVPERYREVSATSMVPLGVQQILVWGEHENFVPVSLARGHVDAATKAGDRARLIVIPAIGHFESASPQSSAWPTVLGAIRSLLAN
jgi:acetyl esterase/lipase